MSYRYLVLGTGVGTAIAYALLRGPDTERVDVADLSWKRACEVVRQLARFKPKDKRFLPMALQAPYRDAIFKYFDVVVSAIPARYNYGLAEQAVERGASFCDLGGVVEVTKKMFELDECARSANLSVIPDCGFAPGLVMMLARKLMEEFEHTESIGIWAGGLPQKPRPPLFYQRVFSLEGLKHIYYDKIAVLRDGVIVEEAPFSGYEVVTIPELAEFSNGFNGEVEAFFTAGTSIAPWTFQRWGVQNFFEKTVRWPGFVDFIRRHSITRETFEEKITPHVSIPVDAENPDFVWMRIEAEGILGGRRVKKSYSFLDRFDPETGFSAMERVTGFPTAIIARMIVQGVSKRGVHTPECAFDTIGLEKFLCELKQHFNLTEN